MSEPPTMARFGPPIVAVVGATASGKTGLSLDLSERLGGEVVNTDAMQVYRGMDVGTAKLPPGERRGIPHHLLDTLTVTDPATVAEFQQWARTVIDQVRGRGRTPVLVGGSALYTRAVLDRFEFPGTDEEIRGRWEAELGRVGARGLHAVLAERDPEAADRIGPDNGRRIVRALEVVEATGRPFSASLPKLEYADPHTVQIGVDIDRETLDRRIEERVDAMFAGGFVEEVRHLLDHGLEQGRTAPRAIGYREVVALLRGELTEHEALEQTKTATRRFARRQDSWFRKDPRIVWLRHDDPDLVELALSTVSAVAATMDPVTRTTYYTATTLDGFIADEHDSLDWLDVSEGDENGPMGYARFIADIGALVMGATTYEWVLANHVDQGGDWPYDIPSWVVSHREQRGIEGADIRFARGDVVPLHQEMVAAAGGKDVWVVGGGDLAGQFADAGLLDEVVCSVAPVTLGAGRPIFPRRFDLKLVELAQNGDFANLRFEVVRPRA